MAKRRSEEEGLGQVADPTAEAQPLAAGSDEQTVEEPIAAIASQPVEEQQAQPPAALQAPVEEREGRVLPAVSLRVFLAGGGIRWDQMAGFKAYATARKLGPMSIPKWRETLQQFMKRPVS